MEQEYKTIKKTGSCPICNERGMGIECSTLAFLEGGYEVLGTGKSGLLEIRKMLKKEMEASGQNIFCPREFVEFKKNSANFSARKSPFREGRG